MTVHSLSKGEDGYVCRVCFKGPWESVMRSTREPCAMEHAEDQVRLARPAIYARARRLPFWRPRGIR